MSNQSNNRGRAYEYICLLQLQREISTKRPVSIIKNSSFNAAKRAWDSIPNDLKEILTISAKAAVCAIFDFEKIILEDGKDTLELLIQKDEAGKEGDVRDILIIRRDIQWEIGLSIKHNHFAVKHSRLAKTLDFGDKWYGLPCSDKYWDEVRPIFNYLDKEHAKNTTWAALPDKFIDVYTPLLKAFIAEVERSYKIDRTLPRKLVEYLLGKHDFYKVISLDTKRTTQIQAVNVHGELGKPSKTEKPTEVIPITVLPTRIVSMELRPDHTNTVELYLDNGWQFSFRVHNASTIVESSLKFDIQFEGLPRTIISINTPWDVPGA